MGEIIYFFVMILFVSIFFIIEKSSVYRYLPVKTCIYLHTYTIDLISNMLSYYHFFVFLASAVIFVASLVPIHSWLTRDSPQQLQMRSFGGEDLDLPESMSFHIH